MKNTEPLVSPLLGYTPIFKGDQALQDLEEWLNKSDYDLLLVVTDSLLLNSYKETLQKFLFNKKQIHWLTVPMGEMNKNIKNMVLLGEKILDKGATKKSLILNFGGGCVMNLGGLVASMLYRGLDFIHIPTSLMAQSDVVISNKQSVNFHGSKNKWGCYSPARAAFIDFRFLKTEPQRQIKAAMTEYCKNSLILGGGHYERCYDFLQNFEKKSLSKMVEHSLEQKMIIAKQDPSEKKQGQILEYGHTLGHALEYLSQGSLFHGEAIWFGLKFSGALAHYLNIMSHVELEKQNKLLDLLPKPKGYDFQNQQDNILQILLKDNKKIEEGIQFIFLRKIGQPYVKNGKLLISIDQKEIQKVLGDFLHVML